MLYLLEKLHKGGYGTSFNLYNAANFGAPQIRERVVILCARVPYLSPTHAEKGDFGLIPWKTLREALAGLDKEFLKNIFLLDMVLNFDTMHP